MKKTLKSSLSAVIAIAMMICTLIGTISSNAVDSKLPGDVSKDGKTDNKDIVCLFRYLSGSLGDNDVDVTACDTTGDGKINNKDVTVLFRYLNGEDYEIFYGALPELDNVYRLWNDKTKSTLAGIKQTTVSLANTGISLTCTTTSGTSDPYATFNIAKYAELTGKPALSGKDGSYVVIRLKSNADGYIELFTHNPTAGDTASAIYRADNKFHYVIVDMTKTTFTEPEKLSTMRIDWAGGDAVKGMTMTISEIGFFADFESALAYTKMTPADLEYEYENSLYFPNNGEISDYITTTTEKTSITHSDDSGVNTALITSAVKTLRLTLDLRAIAEQNGKYVKKSDYVAVRVKAKGQTNMNIALSSVTDVSGAIKWVSNQKSYLDYSNEDWQGAMFNIRDIELTEELIKKIGITVNNFNPAGSIEIGGVVISDNINDALTLCNHEEYCLNYDSTLTDNDVLANSVLVAPYEDESVKLWFDQTTEKTYQNDTESTGRTGYTVRMAKNESENCQFFIAPQKDLKVRVEIDEFNDGKGNTVPFEVFYEYYHNINNKMMPDAIPPLTDPIDISAGNSQGFVIQFTTAKNTPAGLYESVIHIYDADTNKEIKRAPAAVKVWDFTLTDETELRTAFALWTGYISSHYNWDAVDFDYYDAVRNYFYFFQKYRINVMDFPASEGGMTSSKGVAYMSDPRTNTCRWDNRDTSVTEDVGGVTPGWIDKVIYYPGELDEPGAHRSIATDLENMRNITARIKANTPDYRMVIPFERNPDLTSAGTSASSFAASDIDLVGYLSDYVKIWCPKLDAFTTRDLSFVSRVSFLQSEQQDEKYGTYMDRMKKEVSEGDELWTYICINPTEPYTNWQILSDGTEAIVSMWQMKEYDVTGMLYWAVNNYQGVNYMNNSSGTPFGDGILIYSGYFFGRMAYPVSSLRLESIRDGIEDYQMLCMLEDALGEEAANEMISRITTSVVTYANNDDYIHAVRVLLGDTLEAALAH